METQPNINTMNVNKFSVDSDLEYLRVFARSHSFWKNQLFQECEKGSLTKLDFSFIFSQYFLYSKNFTRYLSYLMAACESDLFRSKLSENLWEEGGGCENEKRHAQIFRNFLNNSLGIDVSKIEYSNSSLYFESEFRNFCKTSEELEISAFLSLGTEDIVPEMYQIFILGLKSAGLDDSELEFFKIHIECDDGHSETIEEILMSHKNEDGWLQKSINAIDKALKLREKLFNDLVLDLKLNKIKPALDKIQSRKSLASNDIHADRYKDTVLIGGVRLHSRQDIDNNIKYFVNRFDLNSEVLDPRLLRIPVGCQNDKHRHAHETLFYIIQGQSEITIDQSTLQAKAGDLVLVPRWSMHQSVNIGKEELVTLAVTDFYLTKAVYIGDDENRTIITK